MTEKHFAHFLLAVLFSVLSSINNLPLHSEGKQRCCNCSEIKEPLSLWRPFFIEAVSVISRLFDCVFVFIYWWRLSVISNSDRIGQISARFRSMCVFVWWLQLFWLQSLQCNWKHSDSLSKSTERIQRAENWANQMELRKAFGNSILMPTNDDIYRQGEQTETKMVLAIVAENAAPAPAPAVLPGLTGGAHSPATIIDEHRRHWVIRLSS